MRVLRQGAPLADCLAGRRLELRNRYALSFRSAHPVEVRPLTCFVAVAAQHIVESLLLRRLSLAFLLRRHALSQLGLHLHVAVHSRLQLRSSLRLRQRRMVCFRKLRVVHRLDGLEFGELLDALLCLGPRWRARRRGLARLRPEPLLLFKRRL